MWITSSAARNHLLLGCCSLVSQMAGHGYYWNYIHFLGLHLGDLLPVNSSLEEFRLQYPREADRTMCPGCQWPNCLVTTNEITDQHQGNILLPFLHEQVWIGPSVDPDTCDTWKNCLKRVVFHEEQDGYRMAPSLSRKFYFLPWRNFSSNLAR